MFDHRRRIRARRIARRAAPGVVASLLVLAGPVSPPADAKREPAAKAEKADEAGPEGKEGKEENGENASLPETLDLTKLTYVDSQKGKSGVILEAADARVLPRREQVLMQDVGLRLAMANAKGELRVSCEHGELDLKSGSFVGIGKVRGKTPDGRQFETQRVRYDHPTALVTTDAPVLIRDGGGTLRGGGFRYYVREGRFKLLGGASVVQEE